MDIFIIRKKSRGSLTGFAITPCSRDRWFPATYANFSTSNHISERTGV